MRVRELLIFLRRKNILLGWRSKVVEVDIEAQLYCKIIRYILGSDPIRKIY